jgi:penicillin-binding protein 1C
MDNHRAIKRSFFRRLIDCYRQNRIKCIVVLILLIGYYLALPKVLFKKSYSSILEASNGEILEVKIADDGQWRFPLRDSLPQKYKTCVIYFEDEYFNYHWGFNPVSIVKSAYKNYQKKGKKRGASTITQQVIRLHRDNPKRTFVEKFLELILSSRLEFRHSKDKILELYAAHTPFGGNIVGLEMASWYYFGTTADKLSWSQTAMLAVLPNAPSLIFPGKNQEQLVKKRNFLLKKLYQKKVISEEDYLLAIEEDIPQKRFALPSHSPQALQFLIKQNNGQRIQSSIDFSLQQKLNHLAKSYYSQYKQTEVYNLAILVADVKTRQVRAYVGNSPTDVEHQKDVDIIQSPRSSGSILKPLLFASMLDDGLLLPNMLVPDIPAQFGSYMPKNFKETFDGAIPAENALSRSLNIPSVLMLQQYGISRFLEHLKSMKITTLNRSADNYGLSLILGGGETSLWELCSVYANMASTLNHFNQSQIYNKQEWQTLRFDKDQNQIQKEHSGHYSVMSAAAIWHTFNAMKKVNRPEEDEAWEFYESSREIAWKTGTSFGNRDAWSIGVSKDYVVGVWVGNATGQGRPTLTGVHYAAPIMFDVFKYLPQTKWFDAPNMELTSTKVCQKSGYLANEYCPIDLSNIIETKNSLLLCPYHKLIFLDSSKSFRVNKNYYNQQNMQREIRFVLPPVMEMYYKVNHFDYQTLPPYSDLCFDKNSRNMDFIYPTENGKVYLTKNLEDKIQPFVCKIAHQNPRAKLYWYLNSTYLGETTQFHEMSIAPASGKHLILAIDHQGNEIRRWIEVEKRE